MISLSLQQEQTIRHLARYRISSEPQTRFDWFADAIEWCLNEVTGYGEFLPDEWDIERSYDDENWDICGHVQWDFARDELSADREDEQWNFLVTLSRPVWTQVLHSMERA